MSKWKQDSLTNHVSLITKGTTPTSIGKEFQENGINFIKAESITDAGKFISSAFAFIDDSTNEVLKRSQLQNGDILFSIAGVLGRVAVVNKDILPANTNQAIAIIRLSSSSEIENDFLKHLLNSEFVKDQIRRINVQAAQANFSLADINRLQIKFPEETKEQTKIARILSTADSVIEKTQAAIAKYKAIKQGMLQDLFTRGIDITTNKLRPRYEDAPHLYKESKLGMIPREWEVEKIEDTKVEISDGDRGLNYPKENDLNESGYCLFLSAANVTKDGFKFSTTQFISKERDELLGAGKLTRNDIIVTTRGTVGNVVYYGEEIPYNHVRINSGMVILRNNDNKISNTFLFYYVKEILFEIYFKDSITGTAQPQLPIKDFKKLIFIFPKEETEQNLITERIKAINNKLQNEQSYLQKMQLLKKGLMEDLLSGKKEVNIKKEQNKKQVREYGQ